MTFIMFEIPNQFAFNFNCSLHHIYSTDKNHMMLGCNDWQAKDIGFSSEAELFGRYVYDIHSNIESSIIIRNNENILRIGRPQLFEELMMLHGGNSFLCSSYKFPLKNEKNKTIGVMGISVPLEQTSLASYHQKNTDISSDLECLSPQQMKCFHLLLKGLTAKKIAQEMHLSSRTIEYYITHIRLKLHCKNIRELISRYANRQEVM